MKDQLRTILEKRVGNRNKISRSELRYLLDIPVKKDRKLRLLIGELRKEGLPVLFDTRASGGYYLPESLEELKQGMDKLRSYIIDECILLRNIKVYGNLYLNNDRQGRLL